MCVADCVGCCLIGGLWCKHRADDHGHCSHAAQDHQISSCSCNSQRGHRAACHEDCCNAVWRHQLGRQAGPCHRYAYQPFPILSIAFCRHLQWNCAQKPKRTLNRLSQICNASFHVAFCSHLQQSCANEPGQMLHSLSQVCHASFHACLKSLLHTLSSYQTKTDAPKVPFCSIRLVFM